MYQSFGHGQITILRQTTQMLTWNVFNTSKKFNVIKLKWLYPFIFKVWKPKCIKVLNMDQFQFRVNVKELKS